METTNKSELLYSQLCRRVAEMADGAVFPTVRQLMAEYKVSQATVTPAVAALKERGLLESVPRRGMFVRRKAGKPKLLLLQQDWNSYNMRSVRNRLKEAAGVHGFAFEVEFFDYHEDICEHLNEYEADVIVLDGITDDQLSSRQVMLLAQSAAPVILCSNAVPVNQIRYVCGDNTASGALAARYLAGCGHRKIGLLYCEPHIMTSEAITRSFVFIAENSDCRVSLLDCGMKPGDTPDEKIREFVKRYTDGEYDFTALFAISDHGALIALREFEAAGIRVPEEISILGLGNVPEPGIERLTTVDTPRDRIAEAVLEIAVNLVSGRKEFRTQIDVMPELVVERDSVKKCAALMAI